VTADEGRSERRLIDDGFARPDWICRARHVLAFRRRTQNSTTICDMQMPQFCGLACAFQAPHRNFRSSLEAIPHWLWE
jgi:hypothetical protein